MKSHHQIKHRTWYDEGQTVQIKTGHLKGMFGTVDKIRPRNPVPYYIKVMGRVFLYSAREFKAI